MTNDHADFLETRVLESIRHIFGDLDEASLSGIRSLFDWVHLPGGAYLLRQGETADSMYILASGRLKSIRNYKSGKVESLGELTPGDTVGEMALMLEEPNSTDMLAMRDCVLASISGARFDSLMELFPRGMSHLAKTVVNRMRRSLSSKRIKTQFTNIGIVPVSELPDRQGFVRQLCNSLELYGSVLMLDSETVNNRFGQPGIAQASPDDHSGYRSLTSWLDEQESKFRFVVYLTDRQDSEWTRRCIRQSDEVLLLAEATQPPYLDPLEKKYLHGHSSLTLAAQSLVLLHPSGTIQPKGAAAWTAPRKLLRHHHVRTGHPADFERLARFLSGNAVGLVLSGGGAKGYAHIGVFRALEESGITVDLVGGTSIGAILGAQIARGSSGEELRRLCREIFRKSPTTDFNLVPRVSIFKGKKLEGLLYENFEDTEIEDLWLNFYCLSGNLTKVTPYVHRKGRLVDALRASISIPGVFPPAEFHGELHVDGGVFNNLPVDIMTQMGAGFIIAVDLQVHQAVNPEQDPFRGKTRLPNLLSVVMEASMLSGRHLSQENKKEIDLYFNPPLRGFRVIDWHKFDRIESIGYNHAKEVLSARFPIQNPAQ
jgi:NTE family protein